MTNVSPGRRVGVEIPCGFLGMLALVLAAESYVSRHHSDLAPSYSLEWRKTSRSVRTEARGSEIVCFGDSLVKVGVAPKVLEQRLGKRTYNFALSASPPVASYFLLRRVLEEGATPDAVLVDSKWPTLRSHDALSQGVIPDIFGPREFLDLAWTTRDARLFATLMLSRVLPSYHVRFEIGSDIRTALRGEPRPQRRNIDAGRRNWKLNHGAHHAPKSPVYRGEVDFNKKNYFPDDWKPDPIVATYLDRFFALARSRGIPVFWLIPPSVPAIQTRHEQTGFDVVFTRFAERVQERFPDLVVVDGRYAQYPASVFIDPTHLDCEGAGLFSDDLAPIIGRHLARPESSPRWVALPTFRERPIGVVLEDVQQSARIVAAARTRR